MPITRSQQTSEGTLYRALNESPAKTEARRKRYEEKMKERRENMDKEATKLYEANRAKEIDKLAKKLMKKGYSSKDAHNLAEMVIDEGCYDDDGDESSICKTLWRNIGPVLGITALAAGIALGSKKKKTKNKKTKRKNSKKKKSKKKKSKNKSKNRSKK